MIYGCKKDQITPNPTASNQAGANEETANRNPEMSEIENNILNFEELMDSDEGGDATMSVADVVWNLEALANYTHRKAEEYNMIEVETETITLSKDANGEISIADIRAEHTEINNVLDLMQEGNFLIVLDVRIKEETANDVELDIIRSMGYSVVLGDPFTQSWVWGGYTCGYTGPFMGIDASDIIPTGINTVVVHGFIITNVHTDLVTNMNAINFTPNPFGFDIGPLFELHGIGAGPATCLTPTMLSFYANELNGLAEDLRPVGEHTVLRDLDWNSTLSIGVWDHFHWANITYGTLTERLAVTL